MFHHHPSPDKNRTNFRKAKDGQGFEAQDLITPQLLWKWSLVFGATKALGFSWLAISAWHLLCSLIRSFVTRNISSNHVNSFWIQVPTFFEGYCEIFYLWYCKKNLVNAARGESKETFQSWLFNWRDSKHPSTKICRQPPHWVILDILKQEEPLASDDWF